MANDQKTLLARRAAQAGYSRPVPVPPFPGVPKQVLARFPEAAGWEQAIQSWVRALNECIPDIPKAATETSSEPGPQGPAGQSGSVGPQGPQGSQGESGAAVTGPQGPQGDQGSAGPQGAQGTQGVDGVNGNDGPQGPQGDQGPQGEVGLVDLDGGYPDSIYGGVDIIDGGSI